jgi:amino acid adenylation domain-containing protein
MSRDQNAIPDDMIAFDENQNSLKGNTTQTFILPDVGTHKMIEAQVQCTPNALALAYKQEEISYQELNIRANQLSHYLKKLEGKVEDRIAVCLERSPQMIIAYLAIWKAGGAYIPLDPATPLQRLQFMLTDAQATILITQQNLLPLFPDYEGTSICLDQSQKLLSTQERSNPSQNSQSQNLAYIIYTSGSTGVPKGTMIEHRSLINMIYYDQKALNITEADRATQLAGPGFDASVREIWPYLASGASLHFLDDQTRMSPAALHDWLIKQKISISFVPTPLAEHIIQMDWSEDTALRSVLTGGDRLHHYPNPGLPFSFINNYGPTENTVVATTEVVSASRTSEQFPAIGHPISNVQVYLMTPQFGLAPFGKPGELYIGGKGLSRGYLNRPDLTAERFVPNPFSNEAGSRLYRTGDIARYLPDGRIEFIDRLDFQVKIRGYRIELGEIESALVQIAEIKQAVVIAHGEQEEKRIIAYLVMDANSTFNQNSIHTHLKQQLLPYMIPVAYVRMDEFPLTINGKIDRRALPLPKESERPEIEVNYEAPRSTTEQIIASVWASILKLKRIGIHDNFFEFGGHSLAALQACARLRDMLHIEIPLQLIFEAPTVAELTHILLDTTQQEYRSALSIKPVSRDERLPLSFPQESVWFLQELAPENMAYQAQAHLRWKGKLDVAVLEAVLSEIVRRHEIFRTTFPAIDGKPYQVIHESWQVHLPIIDLCPFSPSVRMEKLQQSIQDALKQQFSLTKLPLLKWTLIQLDSEEYLLLHVEHHMIHDGWSSNVFLRELKVLYTTFLKGEPSPLPELSIQFADFAYWQRHWIHNEGMEAQLGYWKDHLRGVTPLALPTDYPRPAVQQFHGTTQRIELPVSLYQKLRKFSYEMRSTFFMTMLAAFYVLLYRYSMQEDICIGSSAANRRSREIEDLIGMLVNTITLRIDFSQQLSIRDLLAKVRQITLDAYAHQDLPFDLLVEELEVERDLSRNPIFQVMFGFHDSPLVELELPGVELHLTEGLSNGSAKFDLNVVVIPRNEQYLKGNKEDALEITAMVWEYNTDLFAPETIQRMIAHYFQILDAFLIDPEQPISTLSLLTQKEREHLLAWNNTQTPFSQNLCIHQLFETQVQRTPEAIAVTYQDQRLTYAELNCRANQIAHYLQAVGIGPDMLVGICLERSENLLISMLGVLKAGGAYVPLDPLHPYERLTFQCEDAALRVVLTQERLRSLFAESILHILCLDTEWEKIGHLSQNNLVNRMAPFNLAYVIYTSGSTGKPKGVQIEHQAVVNFLQSMSQQIALSEKDLLLAVTTVSFDIAALELLLPGISGACVTIANHMDIEDGARLSALLTTSKATVMQATPATWRMLLISGWTGNPQLKCLCGGEALSRELASQLQERCKDLLNLYGPTESTIWSTLSHVDKTSGAVSIGRPIANTEIYLLDIHLQAVPVGIVGEIYIGGSGLARGYLNRPDLTAERFIPYPYSQQPGSRLYKTGDIARYLPDGTIAYLGRNDHQVKIRGFRIELGEIEMIIGHHPAIQQTIVGIQKKEAREDEKRLVAYSVLKENYQLSALGLRDWLKDRMPDYMIPSLFVFLEAFPLTSNGKIDRRVLPHPSWTRSANDHYIAPRTLTEQMLVPIWEELLEVSPVGIQDNFFALGGHSLLATQLVSRIRKVRQVEIPLQVLFEKSTIHDFAKMVEQYQRLDDSSITIDPFLRAPVEQQIRENIDLLSDGEVLEKLQEMMGQE